MVCRFLYVFPSRHLLHTASFPPRMACTCADVFPRFTLLSAHQREHACTDRSTAFCTGFTAHCGHARAAYSPRASLYRRAFNATRLPHLAAPRTPHGVAVAWLYTHTARAPHSPFLRVSRRTFLYAFSLCAAHARAPRADGGRWRRALRTFHARAFAHRTSFSCSGSRAAHAQRGAFLHGSAARYSSLYLLRAPLLHRKRCAASAQNPLSLPFRIAARRRSRAVCADVVLRTRGRWMRVVCASLSKQAGSRRAPRFRAKHRKVTSLMAAWRRYGA